MQKQPIEVRVISDLICPWCLISAENLKEAVNKLNGEGFNITYYFTPTILDSKIPKQGVSYLQNYEKIQSSKQGDKLIQQWNEASQKLHKPVSFTNLEELKMYSTINAHRALEYLLENTDDNTQRSFCLAVMRAYFEKGLNISEPKVLGDIYTEMGKNGGELQKFLENEDESPNAEEIQELAEFNVLGLKTSKGGVPLFVFSDHTTLSGYQTYETFVEHFKGFEQ